MNKVSIRAILSQYVSTLYVWKNGKRRLSCHDIFLQIVLPVLVGVVTALLGFRLQGVSNLIAGVAIVSALLGAVAVFLFQTRLQLYDRMHPEKSTGDAKPSIRGTIFDDDDISVLDELFFSIMWCILEGMTICVVLIVCDCAGLTRCDLPHDFDCLINPYTIWGFISSLMTMAGCNFLLVLMMCMKRMARIYERFGMHKAKDKLSK